MEVSDAVEELILSGTSVELLVESLTGCLSEYANQRINGQLISYGGGAELPVCEGIHEEDLDVLREIYSQWGAHGSTSNWLTRLPVHEWEGITTNRDGRVVRLDFYLNGGGDPWPSSTIPEAIGRLAALQVLDLNSNGIRGEIPRWIENLTQLRELELSNNELSGEVPAFLSIMPEIWGIYLDGNDLKGCLPKPSEKPLPPDLRGPIAEGPDGKPVIPLGVPELRGVEYCEPGATPAGTFTAAGEVPLTARFVETPSSHDGQMEFTFELRFSQEFELSYKTLRDHAFTVTGGEVTGARRLERPGNIRWEITVRPDGDGQVTVVLPAATDCAVQGAICAEDGKKLSGRNELAVSGPN